MAQPAEVGALRHFPPILYEHSVILDQLDTENRYGGMPGNEPFGDRKGALSPGVSVWSR